MDRTIAPFSEKSERARDCTNANKSSDRTDITIAKLPHDNSRVPKIMYRLEESEFVESTVSKFINRPIDANSSTEQVVDELHFYRFVGEGRAK